MGNGPETSGDGYKFRGRGLIQLTGKNNYTQFSKDVGMTITDAIIYMETKPGAVHAALWFWDVNKLATLSDIATVDMITRKVNGGLNGYTDRLDKYKTVLDYLDQK
jgi:putative chitinase